MIDYKKIYSDAFSGKCYNSDESSPSYQRAMLFLKEHLPNSVMDVGSGRGNLLKRLKGGNFIIFSCDIVKSHPYTEKDGIQYFELDLSSPENLIKMPEVDIIFCLDVLEHIEEKHIEAILKEFSRKSNFCFFSIANHSSVSRGVQLHLIRKDEKFWDRMIKVNFDILHFEKVRNNLLMLYSLKSKR